MSILKNISEKAHFIVNNQINIRQIKNLHRFLISVKRDLEYPIKKKPYHFPYLFQIQTINQCNGQCIMCPNKKRENKKIVSMSDELFKKIIDEIAKESKTSSILPYLQNEPLLDEKIFEKIKYIKKISDGKAFAALITNGVLFDDHRIEELLNSGIDFVYFSIDAFSEETYKKIRPGLDFNKLQENINKILKTPYKKKRLCQVYNTKR